MNNSITFPPRIQDQDKPCPACREIRQLIAAADALGDDKKVAVLVRLLGKHQALTCARSKRAKHVNK